jgi:hypothetical protein
LIKAEKLLRQDAKKLAKETAKAERAARKLSKALQLPHTDELDVGAIHGSVQYPAVEQPRHVQAFIKAMPEVAAQYAQIIAEALEEPAPETNEYAPWVPDYIDFVLPLADGNTCRIKPTVDNRWEIAAVIAGQKYRGTRDVLADAFSAADALVKSKLGTQVTQ